MMKARGTEGGEGGGRRGERERGGGLYALIYVCVCMRCWTCVGTRELRQRVRVYRSVYIDFAREKGSPLLLYGTQY